MAYHGSDRCIGCSAEDCVCCEVYLEEVAEQRHFALYGPPEEEDYFDGPEDWDDEPEDSMDGDFDSGMASAGHGTDEDYDHWETPLGDDYGGE